jgi:hypothetical protein
VSHVLTIRRPGGVQVAGAPRLRPLRRHPSRGHNLTAKSGTKAVQTPGLSPDITAHGGVVMISGEALALMYRATVALIQRHNRDGLAASPLLQQARTTFYRACMSAQRRKGAAYHLAESRCNGQGRLTNPKTQRRRSFTRHLSWSGRFSGPVAAFTPALPRRSGGLRRCSRDPWNDRLGDAFGLNGP